MARSMRVAIAESVPFSDALLGLQQLDEAFPEIAGHLDAACQLPLALHMAKRNAPRTLPQEKQRMGIIILSTCESGREVEGLVGVGSDVVLA
jgi:hypothetical protein